MSKDELLRLIDSISDPEFRAVLTIGYQQFGDLASFDAMAPFLIALTDRLAKHERAISALLWAALQGDKTPLYGIGEEWTKPEDHGDGNS
jgi:hypothetical protein